MRLEEHEIGQRMTSLPAWKREDKTIFRRYRFASFMDAVAYVNRAAAIAEEENHHPFISIDYKVVTMRLTSWHAGGLTDQDFEEAQALDSLYAEMTADSQQGDGKEENQEQP